MEIVGIIKDIPAVWPDLNIDPEAGVIDPTKVGTNTGENAGSVPMMMITAECGTRKKEWSLPG